MNLRKEIKEHSKKQVIKIASWINGDKDRFAELMKLFFNDQYRVVQRCAWLVSHVGKKHPELILPFIKRMLEYCKQPVHNSVKRNVIRVLQNIEIKKKLHGLATTICFDFLVSSMEPVAIKVFSMSVLSNIARDEPGIRNELRMLIEDQMEFAKPAFTSRGKKILKMLGRE
ncbi:MAG: hypothetical protein H0W62_08655 [Chitinophagales bacterium]|nr:hypothetical protein [Chitinophagales bacterium]